MSNAELIKRSGWLFIAGAFAFITILTGSDPIAIPGSVISAILLAVGMLGLRAAYGERIGSLGRNIFSIYDISQKGVFPDQYPTELILMMVIQFVALCILGFVLIDDSSKELATA